MDEGTPAPIVTDELAAKIGAYYRALRLHQIPASLIEQLLCDYHRALLAPRRDTLSVEYSDYDEYLAAWRQRYRIGEVRDAPC
jgi:hypothetical protein